MTNEYKQVDRDALRNEIASVWYRGDFGDVLTAFLTSHWLSAHDADVRAAGVDALLDELVRQDRFTEATLRIADEVRSRVSITGSER